MKQTALNIRVFKQKINMTKEELKQKVDSIIKEAGDDEAAHSDEDRLRLEVIEEFCPEWVVKEIKRLSKADFNRWCA